MKQGTRIAERLMAGTVNINDGYSSGWGSLDAPMGGMKASGVGRRHGRDGLLKYTESQTVAVRSALAEKLQTPGTDGAGLRQALHRHPPRREAPAPVNYDRRTLVVSALALIIVIVGGMAIVAITSDAEPRTIPRRQVAGEEGPPSRRSSPSPARARPRPRPTSGAAASSSPSSAWCWRPWPASAWWCSAAARGRRPVGPSGRPAGRTGHDGVLVAHDQLAPDADLTAGHRARQPSAERAGPGPVR